MNKEQLRTELSELDALFLRLDESKERSEKAQADLMADLAYWEVAA